MQVFLPEPIVCRRAGLPFQRLERFAGELDRPALWGLLDDEEFVLALATMHPGALAGLYSRRRQFRPDRRASDVRRAELTLYRYLVRFCTRNDTTGTAGSTRWLDWEGGGDRDSARIIWPSPRHLELHGPPLAQRLEPLRQKLETASPRDYSKLCLQADAQAGCPAVNGPNLLRQLTLESTVARIPVGSPLSAEEELLPAPQLLESGRLTLQGARDTRPGWPWKVRFQELARVLEEAGSAPAALLRQAFPVLPPATPPLPAEVELARQFPQHVVAANDRNFFLCDSRHGCGPTLSPQLKTSLQRDLQAWFRLAGWQEYCRERLQRPLLRHLRPGPLRQFLQDFEELQAAPLPGAVRAELAFAHQEIAYLDQQQWQVEPGEGWLQLRETPAHDDFERWLETRRLVTTLDLMLFRDDPLVLVSEAHCGAEGLGLTTFFPHSHTQRQRPQAAREIFGPHALLIQPPTPSKQSAGILLHLRELPLAVGPAGGNFPNRLLVPFEELRVEAHDSRKCLYHKQTPYRLLTAALTLGNLRTVGYSADSLAASVCSKVGLEGPHLPAVRLGNLLLSRPRTVIPAAIAAQALAHDPSGAWLRQALNLPRQCFMQTRWKPMFFDFASSISMEVLGAELARCQEVAFSPMLPDGESLWHDGFTSELRLAAYAQGPNFHDDPAGCAQFL